MTEAALLSISARATAELRRRSLRDHLSHHLRLRLLPHLLTPKAAAPTRDGGRPSHLSSRPASNRRGLFARGRRRSPVAYFTAAESVRADTSRQGAHVAAGRARG